MYKSLSKKFEFSGHLHSNSLFGLSKHKCEHVPLFEDKHGFMSKIEKKKFFY